MAMVPATSQPPSLPDPYTLVSGDGTLCFNTSMKTLMVKNDHHQNVLSVTDDPEANAVTVRAFDPATGRQKSMDVFGVSDGRPFHEILGAIPAKETLGAIGPLGGPALPISHESMNLRSAHHGLGAYCRETVVLPADWERDAGAGKGDVDRMIIALQAQVEDES